MYSALEKILKMIKLIKKKERKENLSKAMTSAQQLCYNKYLFSGPDYVLEISTKSCRKANQEEFLQDRRHTSPPAPGSRRGSSERNVAAVVEATQPGQRGDKQLQKKTRWARRGHSARIPGSERVLCELLNEQFNVEEQMDIPGREEHLEQMLEACQKDNTSLPHGKVSNTDWVLQSSDADP